MSPDPDPATLVRDFHRALFESEDLAELDRFLAEDFVSHTMPPGLPPGREGARTFFTMFRDAFPDVSVTIDELIADGDPQRSI